MNVHHKNIPIVFLNLRNKHNQFFSNIREEQNYRFFSDVLRWFNLCYLILTSIELKSDQPTNPYANGVCYVPIITFDWMRFQYIFINHT